MASIANQLSLVLLLTIFSSLHTHARDSQFFNRVPVATTTTTPNNVAPKTEQPQQQDPNFQPENENNYGLYGHESGQLPPSATGTATTLPPSKYLPKNYNPVAYVTVPEDTNDKDNDDNKFYSNNDNYNNGAQNYYDGRQEEDRTAYRSYPTTTNNLDSNNFYDNNDGSSRFSSQPLGDSKYSAGVDVGFQPQGLSDTRSLENGKYFYDVQTEKYSNSHPYENLNGVRRNHYGNGENNGYSQFSHGNAFEGYYHQNQNDFPQEENIP